MIEAIATPKIYLPGDIVFEELKPFALWLPSIRRYRSIIRQLFWKGKPTNKLSFDSQVGLDPDVDKQVAASEDDAKEDVGDGEMILDGPYLTMGNYGGTFHCGYRFKGVIVPLDTEVDVGHLSFHPWSSDTGAVEYTWYGHKTPDAGAFTTDDYNISGRDRTTASVNENPPANWSENTWVNSADISAILTELFSTGNSWVSGNDLAILAIYVSGFGERLADSWDTLTTDAAKLHFEYSVVAAAFKGSRGFIIG